MCDRVLMLDEPTVGWKHWDWFDELSLTPQEPDAKREKGREEGKEEES
jgi:hypothetical protein